MAHKHSHDKAKRDKTKARNPRGKKRGGKPTKTKRNRKAHNAMGMRVNYIKS
jgi:hypothetical protein